MTTPRSTPSSAVRLEKLQDSRNELLNNFGYGRFHDGLNQAQLEKVEKEIAAMTDKASSESPTHTSTPWRVSSFEQSAGGAGRVIMGADGFSIAHVMDRTAAENDADAALIVEAVNNYASQSLELERAQKRVKELEELLKPFSDFAWRADLMPDDFVITKGSGFARRQLTMGDCRKVRNALTAGAR